MPKKLETDVKNALNNSNNINNNDDADDDDDDNDVNNTPHTHTHTHKLFAQSKRRQLGLEEENKKHERAHRPNKSRSGAHKQYSSKLCTFQRKFVK